jgi:hypothetical protein
MFMDGPGSGSIVRLRTNLSPEECWARLKTIANMYGCFFPWRFFFGSQPLLASRHGENLVLAAKWPSKHPYPFWFYGRIVADGKGALIEGKFSWPHKVQATAAVGGAIWTLILIVAALFTFFSADGEMGRPKMRGILLLMLLIPAALLKYNLWYARRMHNTVLPLLQATLEATEA